MQGARVIEIVATHSRQELDALREIMREYGAGLGIDLNFQDFEAELRQLPGTYCSPRGALLAAKSDKLLTGCCALRPLDTVDYPNACEMKRLYVRPAFRGQGIGRVLVEAILDQARLAGYSSLLLDTLSDMEAARALYADLGFTEIAPYYHNPLAGFHYLRVKL